MLHGTHCEALIAREHTLSLVLSFLPPLPFSPSLTLASLACRGSCSEEIMDKFNLRDGTQEQTYGLGVKEVWEVPEEHHKAGFVQHTLGWPLQNDPLAQTFGGSFLYHMKPNLILIGFVVGLDYENPYINPYREFQRWKHHPDVKKHLEGGTCISYGARVLNEGGFHSIPKLTFPGGALLGCSAGFLNSVKIKGSHTAIKSGMVAAESVYPLLTENDDFIACETGEISEAEGSVEATAYQTGMEESWVWEELREVSAPAANESLKTSCSRGAPVRTKGAGIRLL